MLSIYDHQWPLISHNEREPSITYLHLEVCRITHEGFLSKKKKEQKKEEIKSESYQGSYIKLPINKKYRE